MSDIDIPSKQEEPQPPQRTLSSLFPLFLGEAVLFGILMAIGIATAFHFREMIGLHGVSIEPIPIWKFISGVALGTVLVLGIIYARRFRKAKTLSFKAFFTVASFIGGILFFAMWGNLVVGIPLIIILIIWWLKRPNIINHNVALALGTIGLGIAVGARLEIIAVILLLALFSIYDYIAVYHTKHMVHMAREMLHSGAVMGFIIPHPLTHLRHWFSSIPSKKYMVIGSGDVLFPLLFLGALWPVTPFEMMFMAWCALGGFLGAFLLLMTQKKSHPIPALPPIALALLIGYLFLQIL